MGKKAVDSSELASWSVPAAWLIKRPCDGHRDANLVADYVQESIESFRAVLEVNFWMDSIESGSRRDEEWLVGLLEHEGSHDLL